MFLANEGKPALIAEDVEEDDGEEQDGTDFHNKGVVIVKDELEEQMREMKEQMAAFHAHLSKGNIEEMVKEQKKLDVNFDDFMENEYADD